MKQRTSLLRAVYLFFRAYFMQRRKKHGVGKASRLQALKGALAVLALCVQEYPRVMRFVMWLMIYGTPQLRSVKRT